MKRLLLGDEAIAQGAIDAGLSGVYAYPGTPSTEITEYIQNNAPAIRSRWCTNEKTAMEAALGMSYAGKRALVCMKHVGMNVCADAFVNSAVTGVNGGLVVLAADDPSMHSSQNEQDSRFYAQFALAPVFEPSNQQQAYDMVQKAFDFSEKMGIPVLLRVVTRLAHSRAAVETLGAENDEAMSSAAEATRAQNKLNPASDRGWVLLPAIAKRQYVKLIEKQPALEEASEATAVCQAFGSAAAAQTCGDSVQTCGNSAKPLGIIACGIAYNYVMESVSAIGRAVNCIVLRINQYPLPEKAIKELAARSSAILAVEDGQPFVEQGVRAFVNTEYKIYGRLTGVLPRTGELTPDSVASALIKCGAFAAQGASQAAASCASSAGEASEASAGCCASSTQAASEICSALPSQVYETAKNLQPRPPQLCPGCGHRDVYTALNKIAAEYPTARIFGDIGCYTLGALPPFSALASCVDMGASITMAKGAADAGLFPAIAVIGDSTFTHSGMTGLLDAVNDKSNITVIISDNLTTAMTGGQQSAGTSKFEAICAGLGVEKEHLHVVVPLPANLPEIEKIIRKEIEYKGVSVIIPRRECMQTLKRHAKK